MNTKALMTSKTNEWATPQDFFDELNKEFNFNLDVCALPENAKCKNYFNPEIDGLLQEWNGICWMNPPYGTEIKKWIKKVKSIQWVKEIDYDYQEWLWK
jgi:phage N-6-adenine-methyltransferase